MKVFVASAVLALLVLQAQSAPEPSVKKFKAEMPKFRFNLTWTTTTTTPAPTTKTVATTSPPSTTQAQTKSPHVHTFTEDHFVERAMNDEIVQLFFDKPLEYKSFESEKALDGRITFVPPNGYGLIANIQLLSFRTNADVCRFGVHSYPYCMKCVDFLQFATATRLSERTCGDVDVKGNGPQMTFIGDTSFIGGIDEQVIVQLHQEQASALGAVPSFSISLTPYNDCGQNEIMKKCPALANQQDSYCIYESLFCDKVLNCPAPGPMSTAYGIENDESNCKYESYESDMELERGTQGEMLTPLESDENVQLEEEDNYEIKVLSIQELLKKDEFEFPYGKHTIVQIPDTPAQPETQAPAPEPFLDASEASNFLWIFVVATSLGFTIVVSLRCLCRMCGMSSESKKKSKKSRYMLPHKSPAYTRLDTFSYIEQPIPVPRFVDPADFHFDNNYGPPPQYCDPCDSFHG